ncbi:hypothetical protein [Actinoallomurus acaciae]|uniref:Uncharacterized protein n=1 Tax=Actinoallomurus acaciae TaxID=502577 RepID=A0ABV5YXM9_9ACTN
MPMSIDGECVDVDPRHHGGPGVDLAVNVRHGAPHHHPDDPAYAHVR